MGWLRLTLTINFSFYHPLKKIVFTESFSLFQSFVVKGKSFDNEFPQYSGGPDPELGGLIAVNPVADGDDGVEVVEVNISCYFTVTLFLNYSIFSNSCLLL